MRFVLLFLSSWAMALSATVLAQTSPQIATLDDLAGGNVQMVSCPAISEDFSQVLTKIDALKTSIKKDANCKDVSTTITTTFDGIGKTRDRFLALIKKSQTQTLSDSEIQEIGKYADAVTTKVASIIDLMTNANNCFDGDADKKALTSLSGFVSEAATLIAQVAGPWGAPISIGGQIVSGFISGLDKINKSRAGYDFSDRAQWTAYVQNLCTYAALRPNIEALLHPQNQIGQLQMIARKLDQNMATIASVCPECGNVTDATIQSIDSKYAARLGTLSARVRNAQAWVKAQISQVTSNSNAYWNNVTGKDVLSRAQRELEDFLLQKEAPKFLVYQYSQSSRSFFDLRSYLYYDGTNLVHQAYLAKWLDQEPALNRSIFGWGTSLAADDQVPVYQALTGTDWKAKFKALGQTPDDLGYRLINARKLAMDKFDTASWSYGVAYVFCDFFQQADLYSSSLQQTCTSAQAKNLKASVEELVTSIPEWEASTAGVRAADWDSVLSQWSDQVQEVVESANIQNSAPR